MRHSIARNVELSAYKVGVVDSNNNKFHAGAQNVSSRLRSATNVIKLVPSKVVYNSVEGFIKTPKTHENLIKIIFNFFNNITNFE